MKNIEFSKGEKKRKSFIEFLNKLWIDDIIFNKKIQQQINNKKNINKNDLYNFAFLMLKETSYIDMFHINTIWYKYLIKNCDDKIKNFLIENLKEYKKFKNVQIDYLVNKDKTMKINNIDDFYLHQIKNENVDFNQQQIIQWFKTNSVIKAKEELINFIKIYYYEKIKPNENIEVAIEFLINIYNSKKKKENEQNRNFYIYIKKLIIYSYVKYLKILNNFKIELSDLFEALNALENISQLNDEILSEIVLRADKNTKKHWFFYKFLIKVKNPGNKFKTQIAKLIKKDIENNINSFYINKYLKQLIKDWKLDIDSKIMKLIKKKKK